MIFHLNIYIVTVALVSFFVRPRNTYFVLFILISFHALFPFHVYVDSIFLVYRTVVLSPLYLPFNSRSFLSIFVFIWCHHHLSVMVFILPLITYGPFITFPMSPVIGKCNPFILQYLSIYKFIPAFCQFNYILWYVPFFVLYDPIGSNMTKKENMNIIISQIIT